VASLTTWNTGHGGVALTAVSAQVADATQAAGVRLYAPMRRACSKLTSAITAAQAGPPIPQAGLQKQYTGALTTLAKAAAYCQAAISEHPYGDEGVSTHENAAVLHEAMTTFAAGARELYAATAQIKAYSLSHG
jgi:hypothetical protein